MNAPGAHGPADPPVVLARSSGPHGETVLRRRGSVIELVVDGVFAMDTEQTSTEAALARLALDRVAGIEAGRPDGGLRVCVAGLGLGVTLATLLDDHRVGPVVVIELDAALVAWVRDGLVPGTEGLLADPRVSVRVGDVADVLPALPAAAFDAVLLDVDNGPRFLVHGGNARIYTEEFLAVAASRLRRPENTGGGPGRASAGGVLAVWSADPSPALLATMGAACAACEELLLPVRRGNRTFDYAIYLGRPDADEGAVEPAGPGRPG